MLVVGDGSQSQPGARDTQALQDPVVAGLALVGELLNGRGVRGEEEECLSHEERKRQRHQERMPRKQTAAGSSQRRDEHCERQAQDVDSHSTRRSQIVINPGFCFQNLCHLEAAGLLSSRTVPARLRKQSYARAKDLRHPV